MKKSETKLRELKERMGLQQIPPEEFIQFVSDTVRCMPQFWQDAADRFYLQGGVQRFDEETGKPLQTDSRYFIMCEHVRYMFDTLAEMARERPEALKWLMEIANGQRG